MPDLDPWITAYYRWWIGKDPDLRYTDFETAFDKDPALLDAAKVEQARLSKLDTDLGGQLVSRDHVQFTRLTTLNGILRDYEWKKHE